MMRLVWLTLALWMSFTAPAATRDRLSDAEKDWLDKVDPIITPAERKTFRRRTKTGEERRQFIALFWAKRDPDLYDGQNEFRETYLARYDYVMANFENTRGKLPSQDRSIVYLLLGEPDRIEYRIDITIMGPRFRNQFFQYRPELWIYDEIEYDYPRKKLKFQFVPSNTFGDYTGFTDNYTTIWLRKLKQEFIVHPELTEAPSQVISEQDYQDGLLVDDAVAAAEQLDEDTTPTSEKPHAGTENTSTEPATTTSATTAGNTRTETSPDQPSGDRLSVPTATSESTTPPEPLTFDTSLPNNLHLMGNLGYFRAADGRNLVMGRVGFPLTNLDFHFEAGQFEAPVELQYDLRNSKQQVIYQKADNAQLLIPREDAKRKAVYSDDFALLLPTDRYTLRAQLRDVNGEQRAYFENTFEIRPPGDEGVAITDMTLLTPDVATSEARFNIKDQPYALRLNGEYQVGDTIYPVLEITNNVSQAALDGILFILFDGEDVTRTAQLYPQELSPTNRGTLLIHPRIHTRDLRPDDYLLRFEIELDSGTLLISDVPITIKSRDMR